KLLEIENITYLTRLLEIENEPEEIDKEEHVIDKMMNRQESYEKIEPSNSLQ
ncbi:27694_t:CDS:2, partial [Gigaspora margarita]